MPQASGSGKRVGRRSASRHRCSRGHVNDCMGVDYYLPAILAEPIGRDLGCSLTSVFAAFSLSVLLSGMIGRYGAGALVVSGGLGIAMLAAFWLVRPATGQPDTASVTPDPT